MSYDFAKLFEATVGAALFCLTQAVLVLFAWFTVSSSKAPWPISVTLILCLFAVNLIILWPNRSQEELAELAHRLWTYWSQHIAEEEDISEDRLERWKGLWIPYEDLKEEDKGDDRRLVQRFLSEKPDYDAEIDATGDTQSK